MLSSRGLWASLVVVLLCGQAVLAADEATKIELDKAAENVGKEVIVEFKVASTFLSDGKYCFLNSKADFKDKDNLRIVIFKDGLEKFKAEMIEDPAKHFDGKEITVQGKLEKKDEKLSIVVKVVKQITIKAADK